MKKRFVSCMLVLTMILAYVSVSVSATGTETESAAGGYEVLYDYMTDFTDYTNEPALSSSDGTAAFINKTADDTIRLYSYNAASSKFKISLPAEAIEKTKTNKVRWHFEYMTTCAGQNRFETKLYEKADVETGWQRMGVFGRFSTDAENAFDKNMLYYGNGQDGAADTIDDSRKISSPESFETNTWYSVDTYIDIPNNSISYYIDGVKAGETSLNNMSCLGAMVFIKHDYGKSVSGADTWFGGGQHFFRNGKVDIGNAAEIADSDETSVTVAFTQAVGNLTSADVTVKCLETGAAPAVTVEKINDMRYKLTYDTGVNIGGEYSLTFADSFASANNISSAPVAYSQNPASRYNYYLNDDFESYVTTEESTDATWFDAKNPDIQTYANASSSNPSTWRMPNRGYYTVNSGENKLMKINLSRTYDQKSACSIGFSHATPNDFKDKNYVEEFDVKNEVSFNEGVTGDNKFCYEARCDKWPMWYPIFSLKNNVLTPYISLDAQTPITLDAPVSADGFYHVKVEFRFAGDKNFVIYVDNKQVYTNSIISDLRNYPTSMFKFDMTSSNISTADSMGTAYTVIDNLKAHNGEEIKNGIKTVQYSADGVNYSPAVGKVDVDTKYVKIDFTDEMNTASSDIKLLDSSYTDVSASGEWTNNGMTYTLTLSDSLSARSNYTLSIPNTVENADGYALARAYNGAITTTDGVFRVELIDIQKNNVSVAKSDIAANDTINAIINIKNTEGRTGSAYLCICVYNNGIMTQVNFAPVNLGTETEKSVPVMVNSVDGLKIKAFFWDDFSTMKPLIQNKTVD